MTNASCHDQSTFSQGPAPLIHATERYDDNSYGSAPSALQLQTKFPAANSSTELPAPESWPDLLNQFSNSHDPNMTNASSPSPFALKRAIELLGMIYFPITSYLLPIAIALATVNNALVLYVMLRSKRYRELTSKNVRFSLHTVNSYLFFSY